MSEVGQAQRDNAVPELTFFTDVYTLTAGLALVIQHGLAKTPRHVWLELVCLTAELGYAVGDIAVIPTVGLSNGGGATLAYNSTQIKVYIQNLFYLNDHTNNNTADVITATNWNLVIKAEV